MIDQSNLYESTPSVTQDEQQELTNVLNTLLPQIEKQLIKDIQQQLQSQFQSKFLKAIQEIQAQAQQQYQQAIQQLQQSRQALQHQKQQQTQRQINSLLSAIRRIQEEELFKLQQKFLQQHFDQKVMTHPQIMELQKQIQHEIFILLQQKHEATKQRQLKQLIMTHQTKQIKLRKELDSQIKSRIYFSSGLQELKQEIKQSKTQMGSQKSQYNLKLKRIQTEIQQYQQKIKEIQKMPNLQSLRNKYQQLQIQLLQNQTQKQLQQDQKLRHLQNSNLQDQSNIDHNQDSLDQDNQILNYQPKYQHQRHESKTLKRQQKNQLLSHDFQPPQFYNQNHIHTNQNFNQNKKTSKNFDLTAYFQNYLIDSQTAPIIQSQKVQTQNDQIQNEQNKRTLLNLGNISEILKQKLTNDPLQRYLNQKYQTNQNDINTQNIQPNQQQKRSNFAQLYEQHLKKLNKGFGKKSTQNTARNNQSGLSQMAKKTIIKNLALFHKTNFGYRHNDSHVSDTYSEQNRNSTSNEGTQETNLLASKQ